MENKMKNKEGGFVELIILIIVVLFLMSYFHISISGVINWLSALIHNALR